MSELIEGDRAASDVALCLVFQVVEDEGTLPSVPLWQPGPLPVPLSPVGAARPYAGDAPVADVPTRSGHFGARVSRVLYDTDPTTHTGRWHRDETAEGPKGLRILGFERLSRPHSLVRATWFVVHVQATAMTPESIYRLKDGDSDLRLWLDPLVGAGRPLGRPCFVSHVAYRAGEPAGPLKPHGLPPAEAWAWIAGVGVRPSAFALPPGEPIPGTRLELSADWFAQVFRDGIAFVAETPWVEGSLHARLREYVRSIYLDVFLLTRVQQAALASLANELVESDLRSWTSESIDSLDSRMLDFRWRLWWNSVTGGGKIVDRLHEALHDQLGLKDDAERVTSDVDSLRTYLRSRMEGEQARRAALLGGLWSLIATIFLPWSLIFSAIAITTNPDPCNLVIGVGLGLVVTVVLLAAFPGIRPPRDALRELRSSGVGIVGPDDVGPRS